MKNDAGIKDPAGPVIILVEPQRKGGAVQHLLADVVVYLRL